MRLKLSAVQLITLTELVRDIEVLQNTLVDRLIKCEMQEVYKKLHNKALFVHPKNTVILSPAQEIAFVLFFERADLSQLPYEDALVKNIILQLKP